MSDYIIPFLLAVIPTVVAITLHEAAHGYAAWALGDDTARRLGRLSLNPLAHVDRFGTILLPGFLLVTQLLTIGRVAFMFGWAKPVPVDARRFHDPRRGMMVVAAAGPAMNFFLAWIGALALYLVPLLAGDPRSTGMAVDFLFYFMLANIVLGTFNLLPIPPLDGGYILRQLVGMSEETFLSIARWSFLFFFVALYLEPVRVALNLVFYLSYRPFIYLCAWLNPGVAALLF